MLDLILMSHSSICDGFSLATYISYQYHYQGQGNRLVGSVI